MSGFIILESASYVYPEVYRTSFLHKSFVHCFKVEGCIVFVQEVTCPEADHCIPFFKICTPVQCAVKRLANIIQFRPVDASGTIIIHVHLYMVQPVAGSNAEDVLPTHVESMFRYEWLLQCNFEKRLHACSRCGDRDRNGSQQCNRHAQAGSAHY